MSKEQLLSRLEELKKQRRPFTERMETLDCFIKQREEKYSEKIKEEIELEELDNKIKVAEEKLNSYKCFDKERKPYKKELRELKRQRKPLARAAKNERELADVLNKLEINVLKKRKLDTLEECKEIDDEIKQIKDQLMENNDETN